MRLRLLILWLAAAPVVIGAQTPPPTATSTITQSARSSADPSAAFDPSRLARIDTWLQGLVAQRKIPGAVALIVRDGRVEYFKAFGVRDVSTGERLHTDDIFRIASQTKAITSLAAMMLWEEGRFALDDPVARYLPEFEHQTVLTKFNARDSSYESKPAEHATTIRELFTHTSGLDYAAIGSEELKAIYAKAGVTPLGREGETLAQRVGTLATLPLAQEPGARFRYSLSVDVLGRLVEVLSGMPLDAFFRTRIFEPLGMRDTYFELPPAKRKRLVALHTLKGDTLVPTHEATLALHPDFPARHVTDFSGGGGLSGTITDYARFLQLFLNQGELDGHRLLGRKTVEMMLTDQLPAGEFAFGLGFSLETPANDFQSPLSVGSFSWGGAFNTTYWADPHERLIGLIYTNTFGVPVNLGDAFKVLVYSALK